MIHMVGFWWSDMRRDTFSCAFTEEWRYSDMEAGMYGGFYDYDYDYDYDYAQQILTAGKL